MHDNNPASEHTSKAFDEELGRLISEIIRMGELASGALGDALLAFTTRDIDAANALIAADKAIDALEQQVGHDVLRLLALRQPIARDLREIVAALRIASAIERIGDYAANIAKRVRAISQVPAVPIAEHIPPMARLAKNLLDEVLIAYRERDVARAYRVWQRDAELDREHSALFGELLTCMSQRPDQVPACAQLMLIARNLERIGDHATNIGEQVHFAVVGLELDEARSKQDSSSSMI